MAEQGLSKVELNTLRANLKQSPIIGNEIFERVKRVENSININPHSDIFSSKEKFRDFLCERQFGQNQRTPDWWIDKLKADSVYKSVAEDALEYFAEYTRHRKAEQPEPETAYRPEITQRPDEVVGRKRKSRKVGVPYRTESLGNFEPFRADYNAQRMMIKWINFKTTFPEEGDAMFSELEKHIMLDPHSEDFDSVQNLIEYSRSFTDYDRFNEIDPKVTKQGLEYLVDYAHRERMLRNLKSRASKGEKESKSIKRKKYPSLDFRHYPPLTLPVNSESKLVHQLEANVSLDPFQPQYMDQSNLVEYIEQLNQGSPQFIDREQDDHSAGSGLTVRISDHIVSFADNQRQIQTMCRSAAKEQDDQKRNDVLDKATKNKERFLARFPDKGAQTLRKLVRCVQQCPSDDIFSNVNTPELQTAFNDYTLQDPEASLCGKNFIVDYAIFETEKTFIKGVASIARGKSKKRVKTGEEVLLWDNFEKTFHSKEEGLGYPGEDYLRRIRDRINSKKFKASDTKDTQSIGKFLTSNGWTFLDTVKREKSHLVDQVLEYTRWHAQQRLKTLQKEGNEQPQQDSRELFAEFKRKLEAEESNEAESMSQLIKMNYFQCEYRKKVKVASERLRLWKKSIKDAKSKAESTGDYEGFLKYTTEEGVREIVTGPTSLVFARLEEEDRDFSQRFLNMSTWYAKRLVLDKHLDKCSLSHKQTEKLEKALKKRQQNASSNTKRQQIDIPTLTDSNTTDYLNEQDLGEQLPLGSDTDPTSTDHGVTLQEPEPTSTFYEIGENLDHSETSEPDDLGDARLNRRDSRIDLVTWAETAMGWDHFDLDFMGDEERTDPSDQTKQNRHRWMLFGVWPSEHLLEQVSRERHNEDTAVDNEEPVG